MELSQRVLALLFLSSTALGVALGVLYDVMRLLRVLCGEELGSARTVPQKILLFWEDLTFAVLSAVSLIILLYYVNDGVFRAWAVCGMACGFFVYYHTLGRLVTRFATAIARLIRHMVRLVLRLVRIPIAWLWAQTAGKWIAAHREKQTERSIQDLVDAASRGFSPPSKEK